MLSKILVVGTRRLYRGLALLVAVGLSSGCPAAAQIGGVRVEGHALVDERGPFLTLGATLFWGAWGYRNDRPRLERNLAFLADHGVTAVRVLAAVGPDGGWEDRVVDPRWPDYDDVIGGLTDLAFDRYGMRVQWTVFGGVDNTPTPASRKALVDRLARLLAPRAHKVLFVEIANEGYQTGFGDVSGLAELRALGRGLASESSLLVALTSPEPRPADPMSVRPVYRDSGVQVATFHYDRDLGGAAGVWGPIRAPWRAVATRAAEPGLPPVLSNNEPIGPESSGAEEVSPVRLVAAALVSWIAGHAVYVYHAGPGIRGGGQADTIQGRHADFADLPGATRQLDQLSAARRALPADLANWMPAGPGDASHPFGGEEDVFCASRGVDFVCAALGARGPRTLRASRAMRLTAWSPGSRAELGAWTLDAGEAAPLEPGGAPAEVVLLRGAWR